VGFCRVVSRTRCLPRETKRERGFLYRENMREEGKSDLTDENCIRVCIYIYIYIYECM